MPVLDRSNLTADDILNTEQVAKLFGVTVRTCERWRETGRGPKFMQVGRVVRYARAEVERWKSSNTFEHQAAARTATVNRNKRRTKVSRSQSA